MAQLRKIAKKYVRTGKTQNPRVTCCAPSFAPRPVRGGARLRGEWVTSHPRGSASRPISRLVDQREELTLVHGRFDRPGRPVVLPVTHDVGPDATEPLRL